jgi:uncharacterized protein YjbI with pentapeptide repeats
MYKQYKDYNGQTITNAIIRTEDGATVPFDPANTDYANFKKEVLAGAELQDADGNVMTQAEADAFIATLP